MVKGLTLARSTEELQKKAENVQINERADEKTYVFFNEKYNITTHMLVKSIQIIHNKL